MTCKLRPLALNELLDRPVVVPFNVALSFPALLLKPQLSCFREACLTPEITRPREQPSISTASRDDESQAIAGRVERLVMLERNVPPRRALPDLSTSFGHTA